MRREEHGNDALPKRDDRQVVNSSRHPSRPRAGRESAGYSQVQEEGSEQEKNVNQSLYRGGDDQQWQKDVDIQQGVRVRELRYFPKHWRLYP